MLFILLTVYTMLHFDEYNGLCLFSDGTTQSNDSIQSVVASQPGENPIVLEVIKATRNILETVRLRDFEAYK